MAKITARGDREVARWKGQNGREQVLTAQGRLLDKIIAGDGWTKVTGKWDTERAQRRADCLGMERA